jgi:branched-chain amino acid transport system ATP-binding protein
VSAMGSRITVNDVRAGYGRLEVLHGVRTVFPPGVFTAVIGPNGAGKTTLLRVLAGLLRPAAGEIRWDGEPGPGGSPLDRARRGITYIPHVGGVFDGLTVAENLELFAGGGPVTAAHEMFPVLARRSRQRAGTLSGGEHQMLALSRAFVRPARVLLVDEAGAGLSAEVAGRVYDALARMAAAGTTVVAVDQYAEEALRHARIVYAMRRGSVAFAGEPSELGDGAFATLLE